ncbi:3-methyl-2-oxobutanoate hydroxymethyltransferase [Hippea jasoniae]|uniref:3-methyl-2-oxobutanoate hydroxymethyltransferase n=1 Tax=Hippea jasoniae TaxID=944479 RepID=UPI0005569B75|nr:3-methyl-2-oxobutanoate hydroxymethyltransferase [Hippea jasoniae]
MGVSVPEIMAKKGREKIVMITAYDYTSARIADEAGVDIILVGDSLAMVMQGKNSTIPVTVDEMIYHAKMVKAGVKNALIVVDMPFMSYQADYVEAVRNAGRILKETGCDAVKLEGGREFVPTINNIVAAGIPVMGHLGLTPQSINIFGSYKARGRDEAEAKKIKEDAKFLQDAGVFSIVLESVPKHLAAEITQSVKVPTIGIGAGVLTDGQVLVFHDMLGLFDDFKPKFVKRYAHLKKDAVEAVKQYAEEVRAAKFPTDEHSYL